MNIKGGHPIILATYIANKSLRPFYFFWGLGLSRHACGSSIHLRISASFLMVFQSRKRETYATITARSSFLLLLFLNPWFKRITLGTSFFMMDKRLRQKSSATVNAWNQGLVIKLLKSLIIVNLDISPWYVFHFKYRTHLFKGLRDRPSLIFRFFLLLIFPFFLTRFNMNVDWGGSELSATNIAGDCLRTHHIRWNLFIHFYL